MEPRKKDQARLEGGECRVTTPTTSADANQRAMPVGASNVGFTVGSNQSGSMTPALRLSTAPSHICKHVLPGSGQLISQQSMREANDCPGHTAEKGQRPALGLGPVPFSGM